MTTNSSFSGTPESFSAKIERSPSQPILTMQQRPTAAPASSANSASAGGAKPKNKPRKRVNTAEKRNQHNAIERQRRETLNGKFIHLARLLPSLASHRRPSKSAIVNGSISHLTFQRQQRLMASRLLRQLCADRDALAKECNEWRAANGFPPKEPLSAWNEDMEEVCNVEKEVFGTFAGMDDGDDDADRDDQDIEDGQDSGFGLGLGFMSAPNQGQGRDMTLEQATAVASGNINTHAAFNPLTGLITPRSSTDIDPLAHMFNFDSKLPQLPPHVLPQAPAPPPQAQQPSNVNVNVNWSNFAMNANGNGASLTASTASLPFSAFISDSMDSSSGSGCSPNSAHTGIPTPPTTADFAGFTQTPSPRSSNSDEHSAPHAQPQPQWTEQQLMFIHSIQQQQLQQRQNAQAALLQAQAIVPSQILPRHSFDPTVFDNSFNNTLGIGMGKMSMSTSASASSDEFAQSLMASMFPQQANVHGPAPSALVMPQQPALHRAQSEQMDAWRKMSTGGMIRGF